MAGDTECNLYGKAMLLGNQKQIRIKDHHNQKVCMAHFVREQLMDWGLGYEAFGEKWPAA